MFIGYLLLPLVHYLLYSDLRAQLRGQLVHVPPQGGGRLVREVDAPLAIIIFIHVCVCLLIANLYVYVCIYIYI